MPQLITPADYAVLPEDDEECFLALEAICRRNFDRLFNELHPSESADPLWNGYISVVYNAAAECGIEGLSVTSHPEIYERFSRFQTAVDGLITRLHLRGRRRSGPYSVQLVPNTRIKIEHHVSLIRQEIIVSRLPDQRKKLLLAKIDELSAELDNRRLSFGRTMAILGSLMVGITTVGAGGPDAADNIAAGVTSIMKLISKDKETEDDAVRRLTPPPKALPAPVAVAVPDLDDDIPF